VCGVQTAVSVAGALSVTQTVTFLPVHQVVTQTGAFGPRLVFAASFTITSSESIG